MQFLCPDNADVIHSEGVLIVALSPACTIRCDGETLRVGEEATEESDVKGIHVIYNGKNKVEESLEQLQIGAFDENNSSEDNTGNKLLMIKKDIEALQESKYEEGPYFDLVIAAVLGCLAFSNLFCKIYSDCLKTNT